MAENKTYRSFVARPSHVLNMGGGLFGSEPILGRLASEVRGVSAYATYIVRNDTALGAELARTTAISPAGAGRQAGITMPDFLVSGKPGRSRKERLVQHNVVAAYRSWQERMNAASGETSRHVSRGWKRTVDASPPSYGEDYVNLDAAGRAYAVIENAPFADGEIILKMVIRGAWCRLFFSFDDTRFTEGKVSLPLIRVEDGRPVFIFTVVTDNPVA